MIFHSLETNLCQAIIVVWREMKMDRCGYEIPGNYISNFIMIGCKSLRHNTSKCKYSTDKTQPNRKQTYKTPDLLFVSAQGLFLVCYGGPRADPKKTPGWPIAEQIQSGHRKQLLIIEPCLASHFSEQILSKPIEDPKWTQSRCKYKKNPDLTWPKADQGSALGSDLV